MFHRGVRNSEKIALLIETQNSAIPASTFLIQFRDASVGARNLPIARVHSSVVNTMVLKVMASSEIEAFADFRNFLKMEMGRHLVGFVSDPVEVEW